MTHLDTITLLCLLSYALSGRTLMAEIRLRIREVHVGFVANHVDVFLGLIIRFLHCIMPLMLPTHTSLIYHRHYLKVATDSVVK